MARNGTDTMETDRGIRINWGTFNVPTIIAIAGIGWAMAQKQERQDARLDAIEINRVQRSTEINKVLEAMQVKISPVDRLELRVTRLEEGVADVNRRADRIGDSMQNIRADIGLLSTKFEVLAEQVRASLPDKRAGLSSPPPEILTPRPNGG